MPGREKSKRPDNRHNPLGEDLYADRFASVKRCLDDGINVQAEEEELKSGMFLMPNRTTQRMLKTARVQLESITQEICNEEAQAGDGDAEASTTTKAAGIDPGLRAMLEGAETNNVNFQTLEDEEEEHLVPIEYDESESALSEILPDAVDTGANLYGIDEEEARLLQRFQPASRVQSRHLADLIMERIKEKETSLATPVEELHDVGNAKDNEEGVEERIDSRVARVYTAIGGIMAKYTSGKIPKAFKILPNVKNWEQLLMLTKPDQWSPHATYQATRIFAANLNERMAQRFYAAVLLPIVHERIKEDRKLHPALYMAVRKALFKPIAFFKGFLLPLAMDTECTLREAMIVASILQRSHLPPVPTAVCIVKIARQPFSGPCCVLLRVLVDKKMALPYQAIDELVAYFDRFTWTHPKDEPLPVLWHQTLLSFAQRYKLDLTLQQLDRLSNVCDVHFHYMITPETRRELATASRSKGASANH